MKLLYSIPLLLLSTASMSFAATIAKFDGNASDTPYVLAKLAEGAAASIGVGVGPDGTNSLEITKSGINGQQNTAGFNRADVGAPNSFNFSFQFKAGPTAASADGFSVSFLPTTPTASGGYGISGAIPFLSEDPAAANVLAFGFDTWGNGAPNDGPNGPGGNSDYNDISLFWNGALVAAELDPRAKGLTIDDNQWHTATGTIDMLGAKVSLKVDALNIFTNVAVPGLKPYEYRLGLGGRTGGENQNAWFDNINVGIPEPASTGLAAMGLCFLARRRRK